MNHNDQSVNNNIRDAVNLQINSDVNIATIIQYIENFKSVPIDYFKNILDQLKTTGLMALKFQMLTYHF